MRENKLKNGVDADGENDDFLSKLDGDDEDVVFEVD